MSKFLDFIHDFGDEYPAVVFGLSVLVLLVLSAPFAKFMAWWFGVWGF